jgi:hypothetical protein
MNVGNKIMSNMDTFKDGNLSQNVETLVNLTSP